MSDISTQKISEMHNKKCRKIIDGIIIALNEVIAVTELIVDDKVEFVFIYDDGSELRINSYTGTVSSVSTDSEYIIRDKG